MFELVSLLALAASKRHLLEAVMEGGLVQRQPGVVLLIRGHLVLLNFPEDN